MNDHIPGLRKIYCVELSTENIRRTKNDGVERRGI